MQTECVIKNAEPPPQRRRRRGSQVKRFIWFLVIVSGSWFIQEKGTSAQAVGDSRPASLLKRAREVIGITSVGARVVHMRAILAEEQDFQSDRPYPPFFSTMSDEEVWFNPANAVLRIQSQSMFPGDGPSPTFTTLDDGTNAEIITDEGHTPIPRLWATERFLDACAVISDWSASKDVRIVGTEQYRDYPRMVLERNTVTGDQRLYLDPKTGFPVKLDLIEPNYLWGQRHVEYVWSNWILRNGLTLPGAAFRIADGDVEMSLTIGSMELVASAGALPLSPPEPPAQAPADLPSFLQPITPKVVQVTPNVFLLTNPGYNEAVALLNGEIFVFDATQAEKRAREDEAQIRQLFPGEHKINVVVTDLAWPHIAGVRYWAAEGATIMAHASAVDFLKRVIDRRWALHPDALEQKRQNDRRWVQPKFVSINRVLDVADGAAELIPIDGIGSEGALAACIVGSKFLWASDYIQTVDRPSLYARETLAAATAARCDLERVAAEHLPLTDWKAVEAAQGVASTK